MTFSETVDLYQVSTAWSAGLNVPGLASLVADGQGLPMNIHRGSRQATESALAIGIDVGLAAIGYAPVALAPLLIEGRYLLDGGGTVWRIASAPALRTRFAATAHVRVLLQNQIKPPTGILLPGEDVPADQLS